MRAKDFLTESELNTFADGVKNSLGLKQFALIEKGDEIILSSLMIDKSKQGQGLGSKAMQMLTDYADQHNKRIVLTPGTRSVIDGTTSRNRLVKFYKRFGFKENKGRSIDFAMGAGKMYREPNLAEYKVDNRNGLGSVPYNQEVHYFGLKVMMKPSTFLKLAAPLIDPKSVPFIRDHLAKGGAIGAPFLKIEIPDDWLSGDFSKPAVVIGHEGRNRMSAVYIEEGDEPGEVHLFTRGENKEVRARHLTPQIIEHMKKGMVKEMGTKIVPGPLFEI